MTEMTLAAAPTGPRAQLAIVAGYALVAVAMTYPLILHVGTAIPSERGPMDVFSFIWNNWWVQRALVSLHQNPYVTDAVFAPFRVDLRLHTLGLLYGILWTPVFTTLGPVGVLNTQAILTPVLNGWAGYCLGSYVAGERRAGAIAGLLIAATPAINFHVLSGRPSCAAAWPLLLAMYFLLRLIDRPSFALAGALATSLIALFLSDQQMTMFGLIWLAVLCGAAAVRGRLTRRGVIALLGVGAAVAVPFVWLYVLTSAVSEYTIPAAFEAQTYSYPIALLWSPAMIWRAYGVVLPAMLLVAAWRARGDRELLVWAGAAAAFVLLSFGPVEPRTGVPLPFAALRELPGMAQFRTPYRFQLPAAIGLAIASAIVVRRMAADRQRLAVAVLVAVTAVDVIGQRVVRGFALSTMPDEPVYTEIGRDPRDVLVLEVPFGVRTGTDRIGPGEEFNFYQPIHRKRMINGMLARAPLAALAFYRASPAFMFLAEEAAPDRAVVVEDLQRKLRDLRVGYVVMHADRVDSHWRASFVEALASVPELERFESGRSETISYRVKQHDLPARSETALLIAQDSTPQAARISHGPPNSSAKASK